ncbi:Pentatricopeptide repeat [Dillenia turbinata]|uniref:Pentatricopeptide repeat n=1 Tax=Dillenia turbinata TaxID=194707 RepID=A0AAN8V3J3_9MAGN
MPEPDQCSWNSMIAGFAQHERFEEALVYFVRMVRNGFGVSEYSSASALSACSGSMDWNMVIQIHALVLKSPYSSDVYMGSALIDAYSKCGLVDCAQKVFDEMGERNLVTWNSLITCYEQNGPPSEALEIFVRMMDSGFEPDEVTLASVVSACAGLAAIKEGMQIHARVLKFDKLRDDLILGNALVDMFAKCGKVNEARCVFDRMPIRNVISETSMVSGYAKTASVKAARVMFTKMMERNVVSWNALIAGYTQCGENEEAFGLFRLLKRESILPTHYTFGNLLNACANLADLQLGRQAHVHVIKHGLQFQFGPESDVFVGNSLIDMYMKCGSLKDDKLLDIEPNNSGPYVLLSNMYAELGRWRDVGKVRKLMRQHGVVKQPGCSWIEIQSDMHIFMVKDKNHPERKEIYSLLKTILKQMKEVGYIPNVGELDICEEHNESEITSSNQLELPAVAALG